MKYSPHNIYSIKTRICITCLVSSPELAYRDDIENPLTGHTCYHIPDLCEGFELCINMLVDDAKLMAYTSHTYSSTLSFHFVVFRCFYKLLQAAINPVRDGHLGFKAAARAFNITQTTLFRASEKPDSFSPIRQLKEKTNKSRSQEKK